MSLLHEKQPGSPCLQKGQSCWQFFNCFKVLCGGHGKTDNDCWLIPQTQCCNYIYDDYFEKISTCLSCEYFKQKASRHPKGYTFFVADQLRRINSKAFEQQFQKEQSFIEILNIIPDGLFTFDKDWRINYFNPAAEKMTGFYAEDAVGMFCDDVFKITGRGSNNILRQTIIDGVNIWNQEHEIVNINGEKIPLICSTSAFRDDNDEVIGGVEIFKDITELKKLQEEIFKREKKYRRIFEGGHDMIYITTPEGKFLDINPAGVKMLGLSSREEVLAMDSVQQVYLNSEERANVIALLNRDGGVKDLEVDFARADGKPIHALISGRSYQDHETGEIQYTGIIKDITRRKRTEELIQKRVQELSILSSIAVAVNYSMGMDHILQLTLERLSSVLSLSEGGIFLIDQTDRTATLMAQVGLSSLDLNQPVEIIFKDLLLRKYLFERDTELKPEASFPNFQAGCCVHDDNVPLWFSCHLIISKGHPVGFFGFVIPPDKVLDHQERHLLGSLGNFLGNAMENAKMMETIRQNGLDLQRLTEKLMQSLEDERRRLARELHDEAGQSLTAVKLGLDNLEQKIPKTETGARDILRETRTMLVRTSSEIRRLAYHLHPTLLTDLGLEPALKLFFKHVEKHSGLKVEFQMVGFDARLEKNLETSLYRISQEAMNNALKHSGAEVFKLKIIKSFPKLIFIAEDDGVGFNEKIIFKNNRGIGLLGMRERVQLLGGTFMVRGRPAQGARIRIEIPMPADYNTYTKGP